MNIEAEIIAARDAFNPNDAASVARWQAAVDSAQANGVRLVGGPAVADLRIHRDEPVVVRDVEVRDEPVVETSAPEPEPALQPEAPSVGRRKGGRA